jgi:hypothetical protein
MSMQPCAVPRSHCQIGAVLIDPDRDARHQNQLLKTALKRRSSEVWSQERAFWASTLPQCGIFHAKAVVIGFAAGRGRWQIHALEEQIDELESI